MPRLLLCALLAAGLTDAAAGDSGLTSDDLFDAAVLHEIRLTLKVDDWNSLREQYLENDYYRCSFEWRGIILEDVGVRSRGNSTRDSVKPALHLDFNRYKGSQELLGLKSLVLKNLAQDASMLKDRLSMLLLRRMGIAAPRIVHAKLFVNGAYSGVYEVVERIDKAFLKRQFGENDGYLYDYEWWGSYGFEYLGEDPGLYSPFPFQPRTHEKDPEPAPIVAMIRTMNLAIDEEFPAAMAKFLDLPLFLRQVAAESFLGEIDGILGTHGMANFSLYRFEGKRVSQFIAWDKDNTFSDLQFPILRNAAQNVLVRRALENPTLRRSFLESALLAAAMTGGPGGWLEQEISHIYGQIRDAVLEDSLKRCPETLLGPSLPCSNERFEADVERLRVFARERAEVVRRQVAEAGYSYGEDPARLAEKGVKGAGGADAGPVPGSLAVVSGEFPGTHEEHAGELPLPEVLGGVSLFVNGFSAPLVSVSGERLLAQIPWEVRPGESGAVAVLNGKPGEPARTEFAQAAPQLLAVVHPDGGMVTAERPATPSGLLVVYAAGLGPVDRPVPNGMGSPVDPPAITAVQPLARLGGAEAAVEFSGLAPGLVGIYQVNVRVPAVTAGGSVPLTLQIEGGSSAPLHVTISQL